MPTVRLGRTTLSLSHVHQARERYSQDLLPCGKCAIGLGKER